MTPLGHTIRRQTLRVSCDTQEEGFAFRPQLADFNRSHLIPMIERVLEELDVEGSQVRLGKLDIDLGSIPLHELEEVAPQRLYRELRSVIESSLGIPTRADVAVENVAVTELSDFAWYLRNGTSRLGSAGGMSLSEMIERLMHRQPAGLVAHLLSAGRSRRVLERLVLQLTESQLSRLMSLLEPRHAMVILAMIVDIGRVHREEPLVAASPDEFEHLLWWLSLDYVIRAGGSQFNRKSFVQDTLQGFARSKDLRYADLLLTLIRGVRVTAVRHRLSSSLAGILIELHDEYFPASASGSASIEMNATAGGLLNQYECIEAFEQFVADGVLPWSLKLLHPGITPERIFSGLSDLSPAQLQRLLTAAIAKNPERAAWLIRQIPPAQLGELADRLMPSSSADADLANALREAAVRPDDVEAIDARRIALPAKPQPMNRYQRQENLREHPGARSGGLSGVPPVELSGPAEDRASQAGVTLEWTILSLLIDDVRPAQTVVREAASRYLTILLQRDLQRGRGFLRALLLRPVLMHRLLASFAPADLLVMLSVISGRDSSEFATLQSAFAQLSPLDRPSESDMQLVLLQEILRVEQSPTPQASYLRRVLAALFAAPLPERIRAALLTAAPSDHPALRKVLEGLEAEDPVAIERPSAESLLARLLAGEPASPDMAWIFSFEDYLRESGESRRSALLALLSEPATWSRLIATLPESTLVRIVRVLDPQRSRTLLQAGEILTSSFDRSTIQTADIRRRLWVALFKTVVHGASSVSMLLGTILHDLVPVAADLQKTETRASSRASEMRSAVLTEALQLATDAGHDALLQALSAATSQTVEPPTTGAYPSAPQRPLVDLASRQSGPSMTGRPVGGLRSEIGFGPSGEEAEGPPPELLYVRNAGLILAQPFLTRFFSSLGLLHPDESGKPAWKDRRAAARAVHLLQFLVDGTTSQPEHALVLNKLLCGLAPGHPIERSIEPTSDEVMTCNSLLSGMIANWPILSGTSPEALRETFLQREGRMEHQSSRWMLTVQRKTLDVLLDQIPWSFTITFHPWMSEPIHATW